MVPTESLRPTHGHSLRTRARSRPNHRPVHVSRRAPVSRPVTMASLCGCTALLLLQLRLCTTLLLSTAMVSAVFGELSGPRVIVVRPFATATWSSPL